MTLKCSSILFFILTLSISSRSYADLQITFSSEQKGLEQAVVFLESDSEKTSVASSAKSEIIQRGRLFDPYIQVVSVGTQISFPNKDPFAHHVYSFSDTKMFELPLYQKDSAPKVTFDKPGVVILGCNIHDWMLAYIVVVDSPYFSMVKNGQATLADLPLGEYRLHVWHPAYGENSGWSKKIDVTQQNQLMTINIDRKLRSLPQPLPENFDEDSPFYD